MGSYWLLCDLFDAETPETGKLRRRKHGRSKSLAYDVERRFRRRERRITSEMPAPSQIASCMMPIILFPFEVKSIDRKSAARGAVIPLVFSFGA